MANTRRIPVSGRKGEPPAWPLSKPNKPEAETWARIWRTPHAVAWEELGWVDQVARYVRQLTVAGRRSAPVTVLSEVRQMEDRLGLNPLAMVRLRWELVDDVIDEPEEGSPDVIDIRDRIPAVGD